MRVSGQIFTVRRAILAFAGLFGAWATPAAAQEPPLAVCNQSTYAVKAAIAVARRSQTISRGWFRLLPGACADALEEAPRRAEVLLFAETLPAYAGGRRVWSGRAELCVGREDAFDISDARACEDGQEVRAFAEVSPRPGAGGPRTVILAEPADFARARARVAGAQRLLFELGHLDDAPDGLFGQGTRAGVASFLGDKAAAWNGEVDENLLERLLEAGRRSVAAGGVSICNDAPRDLWAAIGIERRAGGEEAEDAEPMTDILKTSRGWWRVRPGLCVQVTTGALEGDAAYAVFAEMRATNGARLVAAADATAPEFCVDIVKFEIDGDECLPRGLTRRAFRPLAASESGRVVIRFDERDFAPVERDDALDG